MSDQQPKGKGSKDSKKGDRAQCQTKNQRIKEVKTQRKEIEHNVRLKIKRVKTQLKERR